MGANHNYFNSFWIPGAFPAGTADDSLFRPLDCHIDPTNPMTGRLGPYQQLHLLNAYATAFFKQYLNGDERYSDVLDGRSVQPFTSTGLNAQDVLVSYHAPNDGSRLDVNPFDSVLHADVSPAFNAPVAIENTAFSYIGGGPGFLLDDANGGFNPPFVLALNLLSPTPAPFLEPHARGFRFLGAGMFRLIATQEAPGRITLDTANSDVTDYSALQFRLGLPFETVISDESVSNAICRSRTRFANSTPRFSIPGKFFGRATTFPSDVPMVVRVTDGNGLVAETSVDRHSAASFVPPGLPGASRLLLNQVRIPLSAFAGIDRSNIASISIEFAAGRDITLSDVAFVR